MILEANSLVKVYGGKYGTASVKALNGVSFAINRGEFVGIMGPSGSGKSTLLNILGGMDEPTTGEVRIDGRSLCSLNRVQLAPIRRKLGFVFQDYNLLNSLTVLENIMLPLIIARAKAAVIEPTALQIAEKLEITTIADKYPHQVSGGQKQRVAIARAIINKPMLIFADEPTGNLDSKASNNIMVCFRELIESCNNTVLMVSHDPFASSFCDRVVFLRDGKILFEIYKETNNDTFFEKILNCQDILKKRIRIEGCGYDI